MARGLPAVWSSIFGLPFVCGGGYLYVFQTEFPPESGIPFVFFGLSILIIGVVIHVQAPAAPRILDDEEVLLTRHPTQRVAVTKLAVSVPFLVVAFYYLFFTLVPYVYPTIAFLVGLYLFSNGIQTYWTNTLTTYYITTRRIIKSYRFLGQRSRESYYHQIEILDQRRSPFEALFGHGNIRVATGKGAGTDIVIRNIPNPTAVADEIRTLLLTEPSS